MHPNARTRILFDPQKRERTVRERSLDFVEANLVFGGDTATEPDLRKEYGEPSFIIAGWLRGRLVIMVGRHGTMPSE